MEPGKGFYSLSAILNERAVAKTCNYPGNGPGRRARLRHCHPGRRMRDPLTGVAGGLDGSRLNCSFSISSLRQFVQAQLLSVRQWFRRKTFEGDPKVLLGSSSMRQEPAAERTAGCLCHGSRVRLYSPGRNRERRIHPPPDRQYRKRRLPDNLHGPD